MGTKKSLFVFLILFTCISCSKEKEAIQVKEKKSVYNPIDLSLHYIPSSPGKESLIILTILNKSSIEAARKAKNKTVSSSIPFEDLVKPASLKKSDIDKIKFQIRNHQGENKDISAFAERITKAKDDRLILDATHFYHFIYKLKPEGAPQLHETVFAQLKIGSSESKSNMVKFSPVPQSTFLNLKRQAYIAEILKDKALLAELSQRLIQENPNSPDGYWFQGQALELKGDKKKALDAYKNALSQMTMVKGNHQEPPLEIIQKIKELGK